MGPASQANVVIVQKDDGFALTDQIMNITYNGANAEDLKERARQYRKDNEFDLFGLKRWKIHDIAAKNMNLGRKSYSEDLQKKLKQMELDL